jgi:UDP-N-acetylmuramoyl-tripeptide--D-alanyl-D-alanine ligase
MAENALLAVALAVRLGVEPQTALDAIVTAPLEHSRLEWLRAGDVTIIDDSYNSNPLSVTLALEVLHAAPAPRVAFLGDMRELGDVSRQRHREVGAMTTDLDMVVAIGPAAAAIRETNPATLLASDAIDAGRYIDQLPTGATVLVKGSRSLLLERLVDALLARLGSERTSAPAHAEVSSW